MMKCEVDFKKLKEYSISPNEYCILFCVYSKQNIPFEFTVEECKHLEELGLIKIVGDNNELFLRDSGINLFQEEQTAFETFWTTYPIKVGNGINQRVLKSKGLDSHQAKNCKEKYQRIIGDNPAIEQKILLGLKKELEFRRRANSLNYMQNIETYLNQRTWEKYVDLDIDINQTNTERVEGI